MKEVNKKLVLIESFSVEGEQTLEQSEISREAAMRRQNRGTVIMVGAEVTFAKKGDVVSYFRAAAMDVKDNDGKEYQLVNDTHILAKF